MTLATLATRIAWGVSLNVNAGDSMDIDAYHRVKAIPGGSTAAIGATVQAAVAARLGDALGRTGLVTAPVSPAPSESSAAEGGQQAPHVSSEFVCQVQVPATASTAAAAAPVVLTPLSRLGGVMQAAWLGLGKPAPSRASSVSTSSGTTGQVSCEAGTAALAAPSRSEAWWVGQCSITQGVVIRGNVAHKNMAREIKAPRIILLMGGLGLENITEGRSHLLFTTNLHAQGNKYVKLCVAKLLEHSPSLVMCSGEVSQEALAAFLAAGVTVIPGVNVGAMKRISRATGATLLRSVHSAPSLASDVVVGGCAAFRVVHMSVASTTAACAAVSPATDSGTQPASPLPSKAGGGRQGMYSQAAARRDIAHSRKKQGGVEMVSYLVLEGCRADLMCTTLLRGGVLGVLVGKVLLRCAVQAAHAMRCESSLLYHVGASPPAWSLPPASAAAAALERAPLPPLHRQPLPAAAKQTPAECSPVLVRALQNVFGRSLLTVPSVGDVGRVQAADVRAVQQWMALCAVTPAAAWWLQPTYTPATRIATHLAQCPSSSKPPLPLFGVDLQQGKPDALVAEGMPQAATLPQAPELMSPTNALKALRRWVKSPRMSDGNRVIALPAALSLLGGTQPDWEEGVAPESASGTPVRSPAQRPSVSQAGLPVPAARSGAAPPRSAALRAWSLIPHGVCAALLHILHTSSIGNGITIGQQLVGLADHTSLTGLEFRALPFSSPYDISLRQFLETSWFDPRAQVRGRWFRNVRMDLVHGDARVQVTVQPDFGPTHESTAAARRGLVDDPAIEVLTAVRRQNKKNIDAHDVANITSLDESMRGGMSGQDECRLQLPSDAENSSQLSSAAASTSLGRMLQLILYGRSYRSAYSSPVDAAATWGHLDSSSGGSRLEDPAHPPPSAHTPLVHDDIIFRGRKQLVRFSRVPVIPHAVLLRVGFEADRAWQLQHVTFLLTELLGAASNRASMQTQTLEALAHSLDVFAHFSLALKVAKALQKHDSGAAGAPRLEDTKLAKECGVSTHDPMAVAQVGRYARTLAQLNVDTLLFPDRAAERDTLLLPETGITADSREEGTLSRDRSLDDELASGSPALSLGRETSISSYKRSLPEQHEERTGEAPANAAGGTRTTAGDSKPAPVMSSSSKMSHGSPPVLSTTNAAAVLARLSLQAAAVHHETTEAVHSMLPGSSPEEATSTEADGTEGSAEQQEEDLPVDTLEPMSLVYSWNWVTRDLERLIIGCGRILVVPDVHVNDDSTPNADTALGHQPTPLEAPPQALESKDTAAEENQATTNDVATQGAADTHSGRSAAVSTVYATMAGAGGVAIGKSHGRVDGGPQKRGTLPLAWLQAAAAESEQGGPSDSTAGASSPPAAETTTAAGPQKHEGTRQRTRSHGGARDSITSLPRSERSMTVSTAPRGSEHAKALLQTAVAASSAQQQQQEHDDDEATSDGPVHRRRQVAQMKRTAAKGLGQHVRIHADGTTVHVDSVDVSPRRDQRSFFRRGNGEDTAPLHSEDAGKLGHDSSFSRRIDVQFADPSNSSIWLRHPDFPTGRYGTVVNVDPMLPGSIIAYTLCSDPYLQKLEAAMGDVALDLGLTAELNEDDLAACSASDGDVSEQSSVPLVDMELHPTNISALRPRSASVDRDTTDMDGSAQAPPRERSALLHRTTVPSPRLTHASAAAASSTQLSSAQHPGYTQTVSSLADLVRLEAATASPSADTLAAAAPDAQPSGPRSRHMGSMRIESLEGGRPAVKMTLRLPADTLRKLESGAVGRAMPPDKSLHGHAVRTKKASVASLWPSKHAEELDGSTGGRRPRGGTEGGTQLQRSLPAPAGGNSGAGQRATKRPQSLTINNRHQLHRTDSHLAAGTGAGTGPHPHAWLGGGATPRSRADSGLQPALVAQQAQSRHLQSLFARTVDVDDGVGALMDEAEAAAQAAAQAGGVNRSGASTPSAGGLRRLGSRASVSQSQASDEGLPPLANFSDRPPVEEGFRHASSQSAQLTGAYSSPMTALGQQDASLSRRRSRYSSATLNPARVGVGSVGKALTSKGSFWAVARRSSSSLLPSHATRPRQRTLGSVVVTAMEHSSVSAVSITMNASDRRGDNSPALTPVPQETPEDIADDVPMIGDEMTPKPRNRAAISRSLDRKAGASSRSSTPLARVRGPPPHRPRHEPPPTAPRVGK